ncbi:hypothetical protein PS718_02719 [Pseudomonas fluorescens]|uniref:Uncharacterized protein n=1 Tax=Pseudomonas fluorescens TaxID=294 RepID=A0A5E7CC07_PSEFL|nr:hypothetical protein PS718_02719 [Pseudomonas fluorescens]
MADARRALHLEPGGIEQAPHPTGAGEGADGRAGRGKTRQFGEQFGRPHVGVSCRSEAVEKPRIDLGIELRQLLKGIADQQCQCDATIGQRDALEALMNGHVMLQQLIGERLEFRPQRQSAVQIRRAQRILFDTDKMQLRTCHGVLFKHLPGAEKIQPGAKSGFADDQPSTCRQRGKTLGQTVLFKEHITGFIEPRLIGKIHVIELPRTRTSVVIPVELGVGRYRFHGRLGNDKAAILADQAQGA